MNYSADNIEQLEFGKACRTRIGMYLASDLQQAVNLGLRELIVNVQDEYEVYKPKNPYCKIILDTKKRQITVKDNMRGIPVGQMKNGMNTLTAVFLNSHTGGKMDTRAYKSAVGLNGIGNKVVCHTSKWLEVTVHRDGKEYYQRFSSNKNGAAPDTEVEERSWDGSSGTAITYVPDKAVYGDVFIDVPSLEKLLREMSWFAKGLSIELYVDEKKTVFKSQNGLVDGLTGENSLSKPFSYVYNTDDCQVELALQWVSKGGQIRGYANGLYMPDGGKFITGFKTSLTRTFNSLAKKKKKFTGEEIRRILTGFVSVKVEEGQFSNQAKTALANAEAGSATSTATSEAIKDFVQKHPSEFKAVVDLLEKERKAEEAAEKARQKVRDHIEEMTKASKAKILNPDKLRNAKKLGQKSMLLVCEGLSAGSSMSVGRAGSSIGDYLGILMLRGKAKNLLSCSIDEGLENEEIKLLCQALGFIYGKPYNINNFKYGKIVIAVDGDADGNHIALLVLAICSVRCPELITENRIYWLKAPLIKVSKGKKNYYFYSTEDWKNSGITGTTVFYKGLGELNEQDLVDSMFSEENQRLEPITYSEEGLDMLIQLMSEDSSPKKDFIFNEIDFSKIVFE